MEWTRRTLGSELENSLGPVIREVATFDPEAEAKLRTLTSPPQPTFISPPPPSINTAAMVEKKTEPLTFDAIQQRLAAKFSKSQSGNATGNELVKLSPIAKALVATISMISFALQKPFSHRPMATYYRMDLDDLRTSYKETMFVPWADAFSGELQKTLLVSNELGQKILEAAIENGLKASASNLQEIEVEPTEVLPSIAQGVLCNYCNMTAAYEALEALQETLEKNI